MKRSISNLVRSDSFGNRNVRHDVARVGILLLLYLIVARADAQTLTTLCSFNGSDGAYPASDLTLIGNTLYGTTQEGGAYGSADVGYGTVFAVPVSGGNPMLLASFNLSDGAGPAASLTLSGNTLYGTTVGGGNLSLNNGHGYGTVFSVPVTGGNPTVLASFNGSNGEFPYAHLTLSGNTLYGTTNQGGADVRGTVFSLPISGGTPSVLASFSDNTGRYSQAGLTLIGNTLYGTATQSGLPFYNGTVFSVPVTGGNPTVLASFNGSNGEAPYGELTLIGNTLYGTTAFGGTNGSGTVFSLPLSGGTPSVLASFNGSNGSNPYADLTLSGDGNTLYGTTNGGGAYGDGTIFSVGIDGTGFRSLYSFSGGDGVHPYGGLTFSSDGNTLYGATASGGANGDGTVFALNVNSTPEPSTFILLAVRALGLAGYRWRLRRAARTAKPAAFDQDAPAMLAFPSHSPLAHTARRAA